MTQRLDYSLGPVQGWVSQARRTRDLWAGSFLLAWLSARAMAPAILLAENRRLSMPPFSCEEGKPPLDPVLHAVLARTDWQAVFCEEAGSSTRLSAFIFRIVRRWPWLSRLLMGGPSQDQDAPPNPTARCLEEAAAWTARRDQAPAPLIGTLTNHFKARMADGDAVAAARLADTSVSAAWHALCDAVWRTFVADAVNGLPTEQAEKVRAIWRRQTGGLPGESDRSLPYWQPVWVVTEDAGNHDDVRPLEWRKQWRRHEPPPMLPGESPCALIPGWSEISGMGSLGSEKDLRDSFWKAIREQIGKVVHGKPGHLTLDLRPGERLCAVALVKRLFPLLPAAQMRGIFGWCPGEKPGAQDVGGGIVSAVANWPSTPYMAAVSWIKAVYPLDPAACNAYAATQREALEKKQLTAEAATLAKLPELAAVKGIARFASLDGGLFHDRSLASDRFTSGDNGGKDIGLRLHGALHTLRRRIAEAAQAKGLPQVAGPFPYFAMLKVDGDNIGRALSVFRDPTGAASDVDLAHAVSRFSAAVETVIAGHDGLTIYAGGEDILALLPVEQAITCAQALEARWREEQKGVAQVRDDLYATLSGGLVFADYQVPLGVVLREAERLCSDVAKDGNNRNSLAVSLLRRGGRAAEWVASWRALKIVGRGDETLVERAPVDELLWLADVFASGEGAVSFFYKMRERYGRLLEEGGIGRDTVRDLLLADWLDGRQGGDAIAMAERVVDGLLFVCSRLSPPRDDDASLFTHVLPRPDEPLSLDALWLIRFLARNRVASDGASCLTEATA